LIDGLQIWPRHYVRLELISQKMLIWHSYLDKSRFMGGPRHYDSSEVLNFIIYYSNLERSREVANIQYHPRGFARQLIPTEIALV